MFLLSRMQGLYRDGNERNRGKEVASRVEYVNMGAERREKEWENNEWFVGISFFLFFFI